MMNWGRVLFVVVALTLIAESVAGAAARGRRIALRRSSRSAQNRLAFIRAARTHHERLVNRTTDSDIDVGLVDSVIHEFLAEVEVGMPGQPVQVVFDTGSSDIWLSSSLCQDDSCLLEDQRFDPTQSSTFEESDREEECEYGSGEVRGPIGYDRVEIVPGVVVEHQSLGLIESQDGSVFEAGVLDGIVGMSLRGLSAYQENDDFRDNLPLIYNMRDQGLLPRGQFSFYFSRDEDCRPSELVFGAPDPELYVGPLRWISVVGDAFWAVPITKLTIGGVEFPECDEENPCFGILDSGSTAFTAPTTFMEQLASEFKPEMRIDDLPCVTFTIDNVDYTIDGPEYVLCEGIECSPGWTAMDFPDVNAFILGDMFLSKYFTVFDLDQHRVGISEVAPLDDGIRPRKLYRNRREKLKEF